MDKFLIAPINTGLQKDWVPWLTPEDSFQSMHNALVWRGRVKKRFGSTYTGNPPVANNSRLRISLGPTVAGALAGTVPGNTFAVGQQFTIDTTTYTVVTPGAVQDMLKTDSTTTATFSTTNGAFNFVGAPAGTVYFYPALPVMGLCQYEVGPVNDQPAFAFDTEHPYQYNGTAWELITGTTTTPTFQGTNNHYFWTTNWTGLTTADTTLFVTNYNATIGAPDPGDDPIWYWDGTDWASFSPVFNTTGDFVQTSRIILPFKNRLIFLSTIEQDAGMTTNTEYPQRCRFSHLGSPFSTNAWLEPNTSFGGSNADGAGFVDAATKERIISAEFIKDRLIVYFEASTYELVYTNSQVLPFVWQKINTELGAVGTFSSVPFDKAVLGVGKTGVHACSGANVERIDQKIPDEVFDFKVEGDAFNRIAGIRDYQPELVYWTYINGDALSNQTFPTRVMVYNYTNQTWSFNSDTIMCWGYFEQQSDLTWENATMTWEETDFEWNSNVMPAKSRQVIFGNQQGFVCIVRQDLSRNAENMQITNMTQSSNGVWVLTVIDHNLVPSSGNDDWIIISSMVGVTINNDSSGIFPVVAVTDDTITIATTMPGTSTDALTFTDPMSPTYKGKGTIGRVSRFSVVSKQWNPYIKDGNDVYLSKIVFATAATPAGRVRVDYFTDDSHINLVDSSGPSGSGALLGTNILETFAYPGYDISGTDRVWHPVYFQGQGNCIQIHAYLSNDLMPYDLYSLEQIEIQAILLHTMRSTLRFS